MKRDGKSGLSSLRSTHPEIAKRIAATKSGCWQWTGAGSGAGYGSIPKSARRGTPLAHRAVYAILVGPIPTGLTLDHLCRNRRCVNPEHLEAVDVRTNVLRGVGRSAENARRTKCIRGHKLRTLRRGASAGRRRYCLICSRGRHVQYRRRDGIAARRPTVPVKVQSAIDSRLLPANLDPTIPAVKCSRCGGLTRLVFRKGDGRKFVDAEPRPDGAFVSHSATCPGSKLKPVKLTPEMVRGILREYQRTKTGHRAARGSSSALAEKYGVNIRTVSRVIHGQIWKGVR